MKHYKKDLFIFIVVLILLLIINFVVTKAATVTITSDINWSAAGIASTDDVIVKNDKTLTVNVASAVCASLQLGNNTAPDNGDGTLAYNADTCKLTVNGLLKFGKVGGGAPASGYLDFSNGGTLIVQGFTHDAPPGYGGCVCTDGTIELTADNTLPNNTFTTFNKLIISSGITTLGNRDITMEDDLEIKSGGMLDLGGKT